MAKDSSEERVAIATAWAEAKATRDEGLASEDPDVREAALAEWEKVKAALNTRSAKLEG